MVLVGEDVVLEHRVRLGEPARLAEVLRLHLVDGDLRPDQDPVAVGHLLHLGTDRVVGADHGGAELLHPRHQLRVLRRRHRGPGLQRLLVQVDAAEVQEPAVQLQTSAHDLDRPDTAVGEVALPRRRPRESDSVSVARVQLRVAGRPQRRMRDHGPRPVRGPRSHAARSSPTRTCSGLPSVHAGQRHLLPRAGHVADEHLLDDVRVALRTAVERLDLDLRQVGGLHRAQIDLAQDPAVVPPLPARTGRQVGGGPLGCRRARSGG